MTRRKSVCISWTLVLLVVISSPAHARPQDTTSVNTDVSTENVIRYTVNNISVSSTPEVISNIFKTSLNDTDLSKDFNDTSISSRNRTARYINSARNKNKNKTNNNKTRVNNNKTTTTKVLIPQVTMKYDRKDPPIRKVLTKWNDEAKFEDLTFNFESTTSDKEDTIKQNEDPNLKNYPHWHQHYKPSIHPPYSEETQVYSTNIQIVDSHTHAPLSHSHYTYPTKRPSPTPIITNVGYPPPWQTMHKSTTQKPIRITKPNYNYHNNIQNYPSAYEVTTFDPSSSYTEKIIIRPEDYSGSSANECPTIFLTLNNTFQGQGKEACPDLNIAVNTNVINKNNVVESEEETDGLLNAFGLPVDDSSPDDSAADYDSNQAESASVETELASYHAANAVPEGTQEQGSSGAPSSQLANFVRPGRPNKDDDDIFSFNSLVKFFRPAVKALGWLASVNPFTIGLFPLFLTPLAFLFASSGLAALFTPWFLPLGREAPKVVHVYRPYWHWDDQIKTWHLHSFPETRNVRSSRSKEEDSKKDKSSVKSTLFYKVKEWMKYAIQNLNGGSKRGARSGRKNKRRKRENWTRRVK